MPVTAQKLISGPLLLLAAPFVLAATAAPVLAQDPAAAGYRVPDYAPTAQALALPIIDHVDPMDWGSVDDGLGFYRDPALHGDVLVFQAEGDLWRVSLDGGVARRITTHAGIEAHPLISPDGSTLAFDGAYEGPTEVYTMPLAGGPITRRTWEGGRFGPAPWSGPSGWLDDGRLLHATTAYSTLPGPQLVAIDLGDNAVERIPLAEASQATVGDEGTLFFVRPGFHGNVTKRYVGGTARDIWAFDLDGSGAEAVELTGDWVGESYSPMWWDGRVYFVTDRDGTLNIWSMAADGSDPLQHTRHSGMDVRDPTLSNGVVVYNVGADLWRWNVGSTAEPSRIPITLSSDFEQRRVQWDAAPIARLTSASLNPTGSKVVLTSRGRVFVAPAGAGRWARLDHDDGVRFRDARFSSDGEQVIALSDATGEFEVVALSADGLGAAEALTNDGSDLRFAPTPSPDGAWIAWRDYDSELHLMRADGSDRRVVDQAPDLDGIGALSWSPDGRWLAYGLWDSNQFQRVMLYDTETETRTAVTSDRVNSRSPAWSADGRHLYFISDRNLVSAVPSPWGARAPQPYFDNPDQIFVTALFEDGDSPFRPEHELLDTAQSGGAIDLEGLADRTWAVPIRPSTMAGLEVGDDALFWLEPAPSGPRGVLHSAPIGRTPPTVVTVASGLTGFELSPDRSKLLVLRPNALSVVPARAAEADLSEGAIDLSDWGFSIDPAEDWAQIYTDSWRMERDYFYDPDMHGVDWDAVRDRYRPLVDRVTTRDELRDVIGRAVGELSALHTSVGGGIQRAGPDSVSVGQLGARFARDADAGGYRIEHIYRHDPDYPGERSPLGDPAVGLEAGDVIVAINGQPVLEQPSMGHLLRGQAGRQVRLEARRANGETHSAMVVPLESDQALRYADWEVSRRQKVEEDGAGQLGYIHLQAMGDTNITEWYRQFYPVFQRGGLILDVRSNRGGNIDSFVLADLMRNAWMYFKARGGHETWNMQFAPRGHMVVLVNQWTASDGEVVADGFRRLGLGPVIGQRTWGGEIWLTDANRVSDGGIARTPMFGVYGPEGEWLIEQIGVIPDIVVDNLPHATFNGADAQLDAAIDYLLGQLRDDPRAVPAPPAFPDKSFRYPRRGGNGGG